MNTLSEIVTALQQVTTCTILMHRAPDGDTVGSAAALAKALTSLGKRVFLCCSDTVTERYRGLLEGLTMTACPVGTVIAVDIAAPDMAGRYQTDAENADIVIDHHGSNRLYGKLNIVRPEAAAAGEVMYDIVRSLAPITKEIAEALYVAVATDTGCFVHGNTTPQTHRVAAELMEYGLDISAINRRLFVIKTRAALMIRNRLLDSLELSKDGRLATLVLLQSTIDELGASEDDMENIAGLGMNIVGVSAAATLRQRGENEYKVSLRTDGSINAATVCALFGGGGHAMAAGCTLYGTQEQCRQAIFSAMEKNL